MQFLFWIIAIVLAAGTGYWVYRADKRRDIPLPWMTATLRALVIFFTVLLLLVPAVVINRNETEKPIILLLQDNSRSIADALNKDSASYRKNTEQLISKLSGNYKVVQWGFGNKIQTDSIFQYKQVATDISAAFTRAQDFYSTQNLGAIILATDGRFNQGVNPLYQQLSLHCPVYSVAIGDSTAQKDLRVSQVYANKIASLNSQFEIRADIIGSFCNGYGNTVQLQEAGKTLASFPISINSNKYDKSVSFTVKAEKTGLHHYVITAPAIDGEKNIANNRRDVFVDVTEEKKNILILSASPHPDVNAIREALAGLDMYKVTVRTLDNAPSNFSDYQIIILHGLPLAYGGITAQLKAAKKPTWYIIGSQSNINALNNTQKAVSMNDGPLHDMLPAYSASFNAFTLSPNILSIADKLPPLSVHGENIAPGPNTNVLFTQKTTGQPLWLLQQSNIPVAILAGEGLWRWRLYEYKNFNQHNVIDECIKQTIIFLGANSTEKPFRVEMPKYVWSDQEAISLNAYLLNANNEQVNTAEVQLTIEDSAHHKQEFSFEHFGNSYRLNIGVWAGGTYTYAAKTNYNGKTYTANGSFVVESVPLEQMETGADYPMLFSLAKKYNGAFFPASNIISVYDSIARNDNIKPVIRSNTDSVPLVDWKWYFFLILLFAVGEWLLRKYWLAQ